MHCPEIFTNQLAKRGGIDIKFFFARKDLRFKAYWLNLSRSFGLYLLHFCKFLKSKKELLWNWKNVFISFQKVFPFSRKSKFRILDIQISWCYQIPKDKTRNRFYWITCKHSLLMKLDQFLPYYKIKISIKKFYKNCFLKTSSLLQRIIWKLKREGFGISFMATFFIIFFDKNFSFEILHKIAKFHYQTVFTFQVIQYVLHVKNIMMTSWHLSIWKVKIWLSQERKWLLKWNKKNISPCFTNVSAPF